MTPTIRLADKDDITSMGQHDFLVRPGSRPRLKNYDAAFTGGFADERAAREKIDSDCGEPPASRNINVSVTIGYGRSAVFVIVPRSAVRAVRFKS